MAIVTEVEIRAQVKQPRPGIILSVPPGTRFTPGARDFINTWKVEVRYEVSPSPDAIRVGDPRPRTMRYPEGAVMPTSHKP
jgi:ethanolamine utilization cobalamin adenosyltransferase